MIHMEIKVKRLTDTAKLPYQATSGSAGFDLFADIDCNLFPGQTKLIKTGVAVALPENHVMLIFPRSGLALKNGLTLQNAVGVLDSDYRNEVGVMLRNESDERFAVTSGMRIAQAVVIPYPMITYVEVDELDETERTGGFGHSGV